MVSKGGKIAISLVVVLVVAVAVAWITWCVWRKRPAECKSQSIKPAHTEETCVHVDEEDEASYQECEYNNLGLHHSKLDVHKCKSGACKHCNPIGDAPSVHFVKSKERVLKEEEALKEEAEPMPDEQVDTTRRRIKFFALFQRKPKENRKNHLDVTVIPTYMDGEPESIEIEP